MGAAISFCPITSIMEDKPAGTIVVGAPGSGKTYFMLNVAANCLLTNIKVIYLDPKNDASQLKNIDSSLEIVDINKIQPGALNPFKVLKQIDSNILLAIIECICGNLSDEKKVAITPIVNDFVMMNKNSINEIHFGMLANYLYSSDNKEAQAVGTMLKINEDSRYGKLIFSSETGEMLTINPDKSIVISLFGLPLPNSQTPVNNYTAEERFSSAIIYIICKILGDILSSDNKIPTVLFADEAHILYSNNAISSIIDNFLVLGRSLNVATVLASQNVTHFPEGVSQLVSNKFMFKMSNIEAKEFLNQFDNSDQDSAGFNHESIINFVTNSEKGECFFVDRKNRGGFLKIKSNLGISSNPLLKNRD